MHIEPRERRRPPLVGAALCLLLAACASAASGPPPRASAQAARVPAPFDLDPYPSTYRPLPRTDTLIKDATVLDGAGHRFDDADVLMRDGKVVQLGQGLQAAGAVVIEARGRWVTPGIIDPHSHNGDFPAPFTSNQLDHSDVTEISDPMSAGMWAEHSIDIQDPGFYAALAGGVTTLQILPGSDDLFSGRTVVLKNVPATTVEAKKFPGAPYGLKMACGENPEHQFGDKGRFPSSRMGNVAGYRQGF
ncbi:MAG: amidohydrolase family protein, partial [Caulobacteraceae bacterium]